MVVDDYLGVQRGRHQLFAHIVEDIVFVNLGAYHFFELLDVLEGIVHGWTGLN